MTRHYADVYKREFAENISVDGSRSDTLDRRSKSMYALNSKTRRDRSSSTERNRSISPSSRLTVPSATLTSAAAVLPSSGSVSRRGSSLAVADDLDEAPPLLTFAEQIRNETRMNRKPDQDEIMMREIALQMQAEVAEMEAEIAASLINTPRSEAAFEPTATEPIAEVSPEVEPESPAPASPKLKAPEPPVPESPAPTKPVVPELPTVPVEPIETPAAADTEITITPPTPGPLTPEPTKAPKKAKKSKPKKKKKAAAEPIAA